MSELRRAVAFAVVGVLALAAPELDPRQTVTAAVLAASPLLFVAGYALLLGEDGPFFELFARSEEFESGQLFGLGSFALAAAAIVAFAVGTPLSIVAAVTAIFTLTGGRVGAAIAIERGRGTFASMLGFLVAALAWGAVGAVAADFLAEGTAFGAFAPTQVGFLAAAAAVTAALLRDMFGGHDAPLILVSVALVVWLCADLDPTVPPVRFVVGVAATTLLGYVAYGLGTASIAGMLTGVLLALFAVVLGGYGWFALLVTFFGLGALASKFRYDDKAERGIAEANDGARGSGNVLANSAVALAAVVGYAATMGVDATLAPAFRLAFAGSVATALADTFSSEFGGLFDNPRLITTLGRVEPGTDGAVTWQGELFGLLGASLIAGLAALGFGLDAPTTGLVVLGGVVGMTTDSLLGATLEGGRVGNQTVNFLATFSGGVTAGVLFMLL
ncbi:DUF92 domain-containing protein [Halosegnis rubeus]|uniref:DUF92 domain-containing protein n=1 Tax=Halosegnis rubeus TaxID=2212850 RepID=A0A5N5UEG0_9EURY|nr:DUF92 domain-containing protein [Halosegnis rubeus]KAB7515917.1 DUF92 domain-containing protein [Halosegnis rubeus]KAB7516870.1 DUF92 domain-containing protein [Halosegnis rubeus]KAB7520003.1 DUF92 domain-containing protein [Halosegnis rubeus]